jgi:hypothetical protein
VCSSDLEHFPQKHPKTPFNLSLLEPSMPQAKTHQRAAGFIPTVLRRSTERHNESSRGTHD